MKPSEYIKEGIKHFQPVNRYIFKGFDGNKGSKPTHASTLGAALYAKGCKDFRSVPSLRNIEFSFPSLMVKVDRSLFPFCNCKLREDSTYSSEKICTIADMIDHLDDYHKHQINASRIANILASINL